MLHNKVCRHCQKDYKTKDKRSKFCSRSCSASYHNLRRLPPSQETRDRTKQSLRKIWAEKIVSSEERERYIQSGVRSQQGKHKKNAKSILEFSSRTVRKVIGRLKLPCSRCGWAEGIGDIHHIYGKKIDNPDHHSNLTYICPNCHRLTHEGKIEATAHIKLSEFLPTNWQEKYYG